jgi:hypothetical protein
VDESWYVDGGVSGRLDRPVSPWPCTAPVQQRFGWQCQEQRGGRERFLFRNLTDRLVGSAAVGIDGFSRKAAPDELVASGRIALRYNF